MLVSFTLSANCAYLKTNKSRKYNTPNSSFKTSKFHSEINLKSSAKQRLSTSFLKALILHKKSIEITPQKQSFCSLKTSLFQNNISAILFKRSTHSFSTLCQEKRYMSCFMIIKSFFCAQNAHKPEKICIFVV